jgi:hypothetical protein
MTPSETTDALAFLGTMFPKRDWTTEMVQLFRERARRIDLSPEQFRAVAQQYRLDVRFRSPDPGSLLKRMKDAANTQRVADVDRKAVPFWKQLIRMHRLHSDTPMEEVLTDYHRRVQQTACTWSRIDGCEQELPPIKTSEEARSDSWSGLVGDLMREGWEYSRAVNYATQQFGEPSKAARDYAAWMLGGGPKPELEVTFAKGAGR